MLKELSIDTYITCIIWFDDFFIDGYIFTGVLSGASSYRVGLSHAALWLTVVACG